MSNKIIIEESDVDVLKTIIREAEGSLLETSLKQIEEGLYEEASNILQSVVFIKNFREKYFPDMNKTN